MKNKEKLVLIALSLIILLGVFLRVYHINTAPPGIYPDEAVNGQDALRVLDDFDNFQWFYPDNDGREGLFMNLVTVSFAFFGVSAFSLKLPAIIFGILAILGTYLLAREMFKSDRLALLAAFFGAVSFVSVNFSRISFRANMLPFILVWSFYFLFLGLNSKKTIHFVLAGIFFGLGMHSYIAFRLAPFILVGALPFLFLAKKDFIKDFCKPIGMFIISFIIIALPMFYTFYIHPEYFWSRPNHVKGHPWKMLLNNIELSFLKYNFIPDNNWRNSFPPFPVLNPALGVLFLLGMFSSIIIFGRSLWARLANKTYSNNLIIHAVLLLWFFVMLVPEFMTAEGLPHALRAIGTLPVVYIWAAFFVGFILKKVEENILWGKKIIYGFFIFVILFIGVFDTAKYHFFWANNIQTARSFEKNITDAAYYINTLPPEKEVYAVLGNMQRVVVRMFNWNESNFHDLSPFELDKINPKNIKEIVIVFSDYRKDEIIKELSARFGEMQLRTIEDAQGLKYYILEKIN
ncbi:MAG: hypothetical protein UR83_C0008G0022 [Candidatus Moranbacteria bacterium GW2011_GWF2_35_54]|nr:MAG: hypothetical protein UR83_C0008G0022 [Candidatus Moranbacteria bacterium GW2011_GWF2_35_54]